MSDQKILKSIGLAETKSQSNSFNKLARRKSDTSVQSSSFLFQKKPSDHPSANQPAPEPIPSSYLSKAGISGIKIDDSIPQSEQQEVVNERFYTLLVPDFLVEKDHLKSKTPFLLIKSQSWLKLLLIMIWQST